MKAKEVWVIVPFSRPKYLENTINNFKRQTYLNKKLIIVENGPAIGASKHYGFEPDLLLTSEPHQSSAKNAGIHALRERGGGFFATFDDDDWYGKNYLEEMVLASGRAEIVGKADFFVRMAGGTWRSFEGLGSEEYVNFIHGPTLCSWAENCIDFPMVERIGEDCKLVEEMLGRGARVWATTKYNFIFHRYPSANHHTWEISDAQLTDSLTFGIGPRGWADVKDFGTEIDYDFVNGEGPEPEVKENISSNDFDESAIERAIEVGMPIEEFIRQDLISTGQLQEGQALKSPLLRADIVLRNTFRDGIIAESVLVREDD